MIGRITQEYKDRLLARVDIVDIVGLRVQLKKAGKELTACCPFHDEKTPSFTVSPDKQFYHCFGCGAHGNAIDFLIEYDRLSFPEAVEELAHRAGMELPAGDEPFDKGPDLSPLYALLERAALLYRQQLREHPDAARAADYLQARGLSGDVVQRFGIGYAPPGWDFLLARLGASEHERERLIAAGLLVDREGKRYDRFRERVMFPIRDRRGRVVGFGGRVLGDGEPKYLNSPETPVFHKGRELYGLYEVQQAVRSPPRLLVVEGYMDVIALAQFEIPYAVATLGTATTPEHVKRLLRGAPELVFCFDGDRAGRDAAWKALQTVLPVTTGQQPIRFLFLPDGEDPDTLVRKEGRAAFERRLADATLLSDFLFQHLGEPLDLGSAEGRAALDGQARGLIQQMPAGTFRDLLEDRLAALVGVDARRRGAGRFGRPGGAGGAARRPFRQPPMPARGASLTPLRLAIALLLDDPRLARQVVAVAADWQEIDNPGVALLRDIIEIVGAYPDISPAVLCERWRDSDQEKVVRRLSDSSLIAHIPREGREAELIGAINRMNQEAVSTRRWAALRQHRPNGASADESVDMCAGISPSGHAGQRETAGAEAAGDDPVGVSSELPSQSPE
jgi:DNA primase